MNFQRYTEMIIEKHKEMVWLKKRARAVKKMTNKEHHNYKQSYDDVDNDNYDSMDKEAKDRWDKFMMNSVNNMNIVCHIVAL